MSDLLRLSEAGLYCPAGDFYIDPWQPVHRAVITHAHGDHARRGSRSYLTSREGERVLHTRMGDDANIQAVPYGEPVMINGVRVSLHPAGHILGSAQIRVEHGGYVAVVSGDYKVDQDPTCAPFEPQRCNLFVTESTFGLPIYRWPAQAETFTAINGWWRANQAEGKCSIIYGYALGKAQRLIAGVDPSIGPIYTHGAVERLNQDYRASGIQLPETAYTATVPGKPDWSRALIVAPPSAHGTPWMRKFGAVSTGFASGWMQIRGKRRQKAVDRGFVLSDHTDWTGLMNTIAATGAEQVWVTHGYTAVVVRWLREQGIDAHIVETRFATDEEETPDVPEMSEPR
jgi:putative mRNA 3-end processing factor